MTGPFDTRAVRRRRTARTGEPVGRPRKLTHESIVESAAAIIEQQGPDALTMRSLAASLSVQASTLYTYFDSLDEVAESVTREVVAGIPPMDASGPAPLREQLIAHFVAVRAAHIRHPLLANSPLGSFAWQAGLKHVDHAMQALMHTGIPVEDALMAYTALYGVTSSNAASARATTDEDVQAAQQQIVSRMTSELPHVLQVIALMQEKAPAENAFRWMIGALIDRLLPHLADASGREDRSA